MRARGDVARHLGVEKGGLAALTVDSYLVSEKARAYSQTLYQETNMNFGFLDFQRGGPPVDIEPGQPERDFINGFPSASAFIANDPDHAFSIYSAFHRLSSRNLLYLEAEIFELQKQQDDLDFRDSRGDPDTLQCFRSWKKLSTSSDAQQLEQMALIMKIREKLKEYRE